MIKLMQLKVGPYNDVLAEIELETATGKETRYEYVTPSKVPTVVFDELIKTWFEMKKIERVRELHKSYMWDNNVECVVCSETEYPCETLKVLNGEVDEQSYN